MDFGILQRSQNHSPPLAWYWGTTIRATVYLAPTSQAPWHISLSSHSTLWGVLLAPSSRLTYAVFKWQTFFPKRIPEGSVHRTIPHFVAFLHCRVCICISHSLLQPQVSQQRGSAQSKNTPKISSLHSRLLKDRNWVLLILCTHLFTMDQHK